MGKKEKVPLPAGRKADLSRRKKADVSDAPGLLEFFNGIRLSGLTLSGADGIGVRVSSDGADGHFGTVLPGARSSIARFRRHGKLVDVIAELSGDGSELWVDACMPAGNGGSRCRMVAHLEV